MESSLQGILLPNEAESCRAYGVSRTAVREAMKMLTAKGLIISRPKIGSRVQPKESWNLLDRDVLVWYCAAAERSHFLASMHQVREILEPEAAALAAVNHTASQLKTIEQALVRHARCHRPLPPGTSRTCSSMCHPLGGGERAAGAVRFPDRIRARHHVRLHGSSITGPGATPIRCMRIS